MEYLIKQYALEPGAWEIQYIEEYFGEFPRRKTADEIITRLRDRESLILMAEAPLPDDPSGALVPVSYKIVHEIRADESITKLRDLVAPSRRRRQLRRPAHSLSMDWRHAPRLARPGAFSRPDRGIRSVGDVARVSRKWSSRPRTATTTCAPCSRSCSSTSCKHEPHPKDSAESKVYLSKLLPAEIARAHRSVRTVVYAE